jgi:signal transduction histidine kinase/CheY-like chemotaxis protein
MAFSPDPNPLECLAGGGEMGALMRSIDWRATPLGAVETWPQSLRTAISMMLESQFAMVVAWGPEFRFFYNDRYRPVLGASKHPSALATPARETFPEAWPFIGPLFARTRAGSSVALDDHLIPLDRNGYLEDCYFTLSYSPIRDESGGVGGMLAVVVETTERVQAERRLAALRDLLRAAAEGDTADEACEDAARIFDKNRVDVPFALLYLVEDGGDSARLVSTSGVAAGLRVSPTRIDLSADDPAGWPVTSAVRSRALQVVDDLPSRFGPLPGGPYPEPTHTAVIAALAKPGQAHPYGILIAGVSPRRAFDDAYHGFFDLAADHILTAIANARAFQQERERAQALAQLDRAKTAFFSNVSHEFRTPLTLLIAPLEELLAGARGELAAGVRAELDAMHRSALRLLKLVNTLLDFSRIEEGRAQASYEPLDLAQVTSELAGVFRSAIERAGLRYVVDCDPLPSPVFVDPEMWEKIVFNLVSNALKFTFEGEIAVCLRWHGAFVELEVRDTGTGIPQAELPNLFKRFHRVQGARSRSHEGTGIGLALVQDLLRLHGGGISVESALGSGTAFKATVLTGTAHLPPDRVRLAPAHATRTRANAFLSEANAWLSDEPRTRGSSDPSELAPVMLATSRARIVVVDDNADMREYLQRILGRHWRVQALADGRLALEQARKDPPDLVLTDVMMPRLDGFQLLRELRQDERTRWVPVVMLSARAGEEARIEGLHAGADDYLTKPFSARELVARVSSQLSLVQARRAIAEQRATLYSIFMQTPTPICILRGPEHVIELANAACCEVWRRPQDAVVGRSLFEALPELESQVFRDLLDGVLRSGESHLGKEMPAEVGPAAARHTVYFNFVYSPLRDVNGAVEGVLVIAFDVTDEVHARNELERTLEYNEMFAGILGHDLRNPLSAVVTGAQVLLSQPVQDDYVAKAASRILSSGLRMARMVDQLLDFTRIRLGGGIAIERRQVDLAEVVERVIGEVQAANPSWKVCIEALGDVVGHWDADRLAQVVSNLAGNAARHGASSAPCSVRLDGHDPRAVVLTFTNDGAIPEELLPVLFDPFRGARRVQTNLSGLGLGLFITRAILLAHGGDVTVTSSERTGTRFTVVLPRERAS